MSEEEVTAMHLAAGSPVGADDQPGLPQAVHGLLDWIVESSDDWIWSVDSQSFRLLSFNQRLSSYFSQNRGIRLEKGLQSADLFATDDYVQLWDGFFRRALAEGSFTAPYTVYGGTHTLRLSFQYVEPLGAIFVLAKDASALEKATDQVQRLLLFEMLISELSARFVDATAETLGTEMEDALRRLSDYLDVDNASVWEPAAAGPSFTLTFIQRRLPGPPIPAETDSAALFPWCTERLAQNRIVQVDSMQQLPPEAARDRETWQHFGVKSSLVFPLAGSDGAVRGWLTFGRVREERAWPPEIVNRLALVARIFADAFDRKHWETAQRQLLHDLSERVKELTALHRATRLLESSATPLPTLFQQLVETLTPAWQYPEVTAGRVVYGADEYVTAGFAPSPWSQRATFLAGGQAGLIEVVYLEERPPAAEGPFLAEERSLIDSLAEILRAALDRRAAEASLRESEQRFRSLAEHSPDIIFRFQVAPERRWVYMSPASTPTLGYPPEDFYADPDLSLRMVLPEDRTALEAVQFGKGDAAVATVRYRHRNGSIVWLEVHRSFAFGPAGEVLGYIGIARDITALHNREVAQRVLAEIDRQILRDDSLDAILRSVTQQLTREFELALAWIGLKRPDGSIEIRAPAGPAAAYTEALRLRWDQGPHGHGPAGAVMHSREPRVCDIASDPLFAVWRERALAHGLHGSLCLPLLVRGEAIGVLTLYSAYAPSSGVFGSATVDLLATFANQVAVSLLAAEHRRQLTLQSAALRTAANAIIITDRDGTIEWVNPAFERLTGYAADEAIGATQHFLQADAAYQPLWEAMRNGQVWQGELMSRRKDGSQYTEEQTITPVRDANGAVSHFVAIKQDVSARKRHEEELLYLATHDVLTDLPNRRALQEALPAALDRARRGEPSALLLLDLDNFKVINDTVGHSAGDRLLLEIADKLKAALQPSDLLARIGGDEFALLVEDTTTVPATTTAERLRGALEEHRFAAEGHTFAPTASLGVVQLEGDLEPERLLAVADAAVFRAKATGRNRTVLFRDEDTGREALAGVSDWATRVREALREDRLLLYIQPIVRLSDGAVQHYEVLLRLRDEAGQIVPPGAFLPSAERFGLMPAIDRQVVRQALALLQQQPDLRLFVNLSGASLADELLLDEIEARVVAASLAPERLAFEITETVAMDSPTRARHWMRRLKQAGCHFALDDFGIGFSSFAYLQQLPADYVKIDGSFVRDLDSNATNRALVQAITAVAHALGKETIAEWVENESTATILRDLGVEHGQGYLWGRPEPAPAAR